MENTASYQGRVKGARDVNRLNGITTRHPVMLNLQHHMNSLHLYSCMCRLKVGRGKAMKIARLYEQVVHSVLY